jgi:membrane protein
MATMARMADARRVLRSVGVIGFTRRVWREIHADNLAAWAAAMAYSWLFAIFPFLIFLLSLMPLLPQNAKSNAKDKIFDTCYEYLPKPAADTLWMNVVEILSRPQKSLLSLGLIVSIWSASGGIHMTISAIDRCYEIEKSRPYYKQRLTAIALTSVVATLVLLLLVLLPIGTIALHWLDRTDKVYISWPLLWAWKILRYPAALLVMFTVVHVLYYWGPNIRQKFHYVTPGAVFCVAVWIALGLLFRLYVERFGRYNETYGTVGGVAVLLLFFYIDALVLLVGVEINSEIDFESLGVRRGSNDFTVEAQPEKELANLTGLA